MSQIYQKLPKVPEVTIENDRERPNDIGDHGSLTINRILRFLKRQ